jgi:hypothetical protein
VSSDITSGVIARQKNDVEEKEVVKMADGESPYDYLSPETRAELKGAFKVLPSARQLFERGQVGGVVAELYRAGQGDLAFRLDLQMPNKFSA